MILTARDICINYGKLSALRGVSLGVDEGECLAIVGPNGAGKSTLLKGLIGIKEINSGELRMFDEDVRRLSVRARMRRGLVLVPEGRMVIANLTVRDNLELGAIAHGLRRPDPAAIEAVLGLFPRLRDRLDQLAGSLSGGEQQMLAIGRAQLARPKVLLLDEPSLGLAPVVINRVLESLRRLKAAGQTIVIVEQNARVALALADKAMVLVAGVTRYSGDSAHLATEGALRDLYFHAAEQDSAQKTHKEE